MQAPCSQKRKNLLDWGLHIFQHSSLHSVKILRLQIQKSEKSDLLSHNSKPRHELNQRRNRENKVAGGISRNPGQLLSMQTRMLMLGLYRDNGKENGNYYRCYLLGYSI